MFAHNCGVFFVGCGIIPPMAFHTFSDRFRPFGINNNCDGASTDFELLHKRLLTVQSDHVPMRSGSSMLSLLWIICIAI
jgi:hypothetical protein